MKILFIGDIVAKPGRDAVKEVLPGLIKEHSFDLVIANAENLAHGRGATELTIKEMINAGVNFFTGGDHLFWHKDFEDVIDSLPVIRPANYPGRTPGKGFGTLKTSTGKNVLVINLIGRTSFSAINSYLDDPFKKADEILSSVDTASFDAILVDFHAEATSEKYALGFYLDGRVTALLGTHTHVPTCDNIFLPKGTMYITDIGMTGNYDSVLGVKKDIIINSFLTAHNQRFEWEEAGRKAFRSVILDMDKNTIERLDRYIV